jgi:hypothetical protein
MAYLIAHPCLHKIYSPVGTLCGLYLSLPDIFGSAISDIAIRWWENRTHIRHPLRPSNNTPKLKNISTVQNLKLHSWRAGYGAVRGRPLPQLAHRFPGCRLLPSWAEQYAHDAHRNYYENFENF